MRQVYFRIIVPVAIILSLVLCSCGGGSSGTVVDYDAAAFENALVQGENLEGKSVLFTVTELHPDSVLGYNVCGGEHLNFISSSNPNLKVGDTAGVKATEIQNLLGSWIIRYERIDNPVIGESTIVSDSQNNQPAEEQVQEAVPQEETASEPSGTEDSPAAAQAEAESQDAPDAAQAETGSQDSPGAASQAANVSQDAPDAAQAETESQDSSDSAQAETGSQDSPGAASQTETKSDAAQAETDSGTSSEAGSTEAAQADGQEDSVLEIVDSKIVTFSDYFGSPVVSAYVAYKNNSEYNVGISDARIDYQDNDGKLLATDQYANCIPSVIKPGQVCYLYSYYCDLEGVDTSNGLVFVPDGQIYEASNFYELDVSDVSFKTDDVLDIEIIGRAANNTDEDCFAEPGAVYFDSENHVVGFCYGMESFAAGQTQSFEISGDMLSEDLDPSIVDHVEVYVQGNNY